MSDETPMSERADIAPNAVPQPQPDATVEPGAAEMPAPEPLAALPASEPLTALPAPMAAAREAAGDRLYNAYHATLASIGAAQTAVASDMAAIMLELGGLTRSNLTAAGDSAAALFAAGSIRDAVEIQLGFARRSLDSMVGGSTRLGQLGLRLANDASLSLNSRFSAP